jgi:DNA invertase Pin-like site-specific DNA recombinase
LQSAGRAERVTIGIEVTKASARDLITMLDDLKQRGVKFRSLTEAIDTETPTGRAV